MNTNNDDLEQIEQDLKEAEAQEDLTGHKVSGKSVFEIERILKEKGEKVQNEREEA